MQGNVCSVHQVQMNLSLQGVGYVMSPYVEECVDEYPLNCANPGIDAAFIYRILSAVGIDLKIIKVSSMDESYEMLRNGSADIGIMSEVTNLPELADFLDQTTTINSDSLGLVVKKTLKLQSIESSTLSKSFHYSVWIISAALILISYQFQVLLGYLHLNCYGFVSSRHSKLFSKYHSAFRLIKQISITWLSIQIGIYAASLCISVFSRQLGPILPFKDFDELSWKVYRNECKVYTFEHIREEYVQVFPSENGSAIYDDEKRIKAAFKKNPPVSVADNLESDNVLVNMLLNSKTCATLVDYSSRKSYWILYSEKLHVIADEKMVGRNYVYFFRKDLPFSMKNLIQAAFEGGSNADLYSSLTDRDAQKRRRSANIKRQLIDSSIIFDDQKVTLWDLKEAFIVLASGTALSGAVFITELQLKNSYLNKP